MRALALELSRADRLKETRRSQSEHIRMFSSTRRQKYHSGLISGLTVMLTLNRGSQILKLTIRLLFNTITTVKPELNDCCVVLAKTGSELQGAAFLPQMFAVPSVLLRGTTGLLPVSLWP